MAQIGIGVGVGVVAQTADDTITTSKNTSGIDPRRFTRRGVRRRRPSTSTGPNTIITGRIEVLPPPMVQPLSFEFGMGVAGRVGVGGWKGTVFVGVGVGNGWHLPSTQELTPSMHVVPQHGSSDPPQDTQMSATQTVSGAKQLP